MIAAEALRLHYRGIATIAGTTRLRQEHIEVVVRVVALLEAIPAYGHAGRDAAGAAPVGHHMGHPDQSALGVVVIAAHCKIQFKH